MQKANRLLRLAIVLLALLGLQIGIKDAWAFEPLNTDDAGTVKKGGNQIEQYFYYIHQVNQAGGSGEQDVSPGEEFIGPGSSKAFPFTYTRGVAENVELAIGTTYNATPRGNYSPVSGTQLSAKWRFFGEEGEDLNLALKPVIQLPNSKQQQVAGFGQALANYGASFIASQYWGEEFELHVNAAYMWSPYNTNYLSGGSASPLRTNLYTLSAAPVWNILDDLRLALDIGISTNPISTGQASTMYGMVAAIISISDSVDLGVSFLRSAQNSGYVLIGNGPNSTRLDTGITWRFD